MVKIMTNTGIIPTRSQLHDVVHDLHPEKMTAGTNVYKGVCNGNDVALKSPRHRSRVDGPGALPAVSFQRLSSMQGADTEFHAFQDLYREYYVLSCLDHPHIVPVQGIFVDPDDSLPAMVLPYMPNGTIDIFLEANPGADRLCLVLAFILWVLMKKP